jgi:apolipoprotein N-acyltransferase
VLLGGFTSLSLPPFNYVVVNFITFSLFFVFIIKKKNLLYNKRFNFLYGWLFGFGYFFTSLYWVSISLTFDQTFKFLIPFVLFLIPASLAIFYGIAIYLFSIFRLKKIFSSFLLFSLIFSILEFVRGYIFTGFPWNLIAYSLSEILNIVSIISIIGTYAFNMLCISLFTVPALFILRDSRKDIYICIFFLLIPIFFLFYGNSYNKNFFLSEINNNNFIIRAIGSNISLDRFYEQGEESVVIDELINISEPNIDTKTFFVWPEGIIPNISQDELINFKQKFKENFNKNHLIGMGISSQFKKNGKKNFYNSFSIYDNQVNLLNSYNKVKLVPFGEFLPFEFFLSRFGLKNLTNNYQSYSSGVKRKVININYGDFSFKFLPTICYEIIYSGAISNNQDFDFLINISEDGWFGKSIGPKQHFTHSIFRAIESGKYVIRSSNNGIAAIINPLGIVEKKVPFGSTGYVDFSESRIIQSTIFSKYGNKMFGLLILLYIFLIFSSNKIKYE